MLAATIRTALLYVCHSRNDHTFGTKGAIIAAETMGNSMIPQKDNGSSVRSPISLWTAIERTRFFGAKAEGHAWEG